MQILTRAVAWTMIVLALTAIQSPAQSIYEPYTFTTLAGNAGYGSADGTGSAPRFRGHSGFSSAFGVAVDGAGNVYVAEWLNHSIRKGYPAPRIFNSGPSPGFNGGQFDFNLTGPSGRTVVVKASSDLVNWLPLWTNFFTFPAPLNFSDAQSSGVSTRYYHARLP
ncbi:MAG: hypothetical protein EXS31_11885 [Pedosphaera sp.]|nr:hypothetical protein [Pedosphaera sp.]